MVQQYQNPFANLSLIIPETQRNYYDQYCQTQTVGRANVDRSPFRRMVDLWFAGLSFAAHKQLKPVDTTKKKTQPFITGKIFDGEDSWRIQVIILVAMAEDGNLKIIQEPGQMMDLANNLAAAGVELIMEMLREGDQTPIWNLSDALDDIFRVEQESA